MKPKSSLLNLFKSFPFSFVMSVPPTKICPAVTLSIVDMQFSNVVLPEPEEPMIATNSPFSTSNDMLSMALVKLDLLP